MSECHGTAIIKVTFKLRMSHVQTSSFIGTESWLHNASCIREKREVFLPTIRLRSNEEIKAMEEEAEDTAALSDIRRRKRRARRRQQDARTLRDPSQLYD